jgi:N-acetyl-1-D-myo-inositol-2-amino-2-deoxy-alpha-D-glucopyranoside deacetylase
VTGGLLGVFAHPDDEAYSVAGSLARHTDEGIPATILCFTRGEAGQITEGSGATRENLGEVRESELRAACKIVGVEDVRIVGTPDGGTEATAEGVATIVAAIGELQPRVIVTMEPQGVTRHPDHIAVSKMATDAFHLARERSGGAYPERLYYAAIPKNALDAFSAELARRGIGPFTQPDDPLAVQAAPDSSIACVVDVMPWVGRKTEALRAHLTQSMEMAAWMPEELLHLFLGIEAFQRPFPAATDGRGETDLFAVYRDASGLVR